MSKNIKYSASFFVIVFSLMFGFVVNAEENTKTDGPYVAEECKLISGCNGPIICVNKDFDDNINSTCEFSPRYSCYKKSVARCEKQPSGNCQWTNTPELQSCFNSFGNDDTRGEELKKRFEGLKDGLKDRNEDDKIKKDEFKKEVGPAGDGLRAQKEMNKERIEKMVESVKAERERFRAEFEVKKEQAKVKVESMRESFKENLKKIKDEKKLVSSEKIVDIIIGLNKKITDNLFEKTDKIENVLISIESRITKAEDRGLNVEAVKKEVEKSKEAIKIAREAISNQAGKVYDLKITSEASLRADMQKLRDLFREDIKNVTEKVKLAHTAVRNTATTLAQIPKIDDVSDSKVDVNVSTSATITN